MKNPPRALIIFCSLIATLGCGSPSPEWNGTWKLNPSKSSFQGPTFTISVSPDGEYTYDNGTTKHTFRCDGTYQPMKEGRTQACVKKSASELDLTREENGVKTNTYQWELSPDKNTYTSTATTFGPSGPVITGTLVASRLSGTNDFAGRWQDLSYLREHSVMILTLDSKTIHIGYPDAEFHIDAPLDGTEVPLRGPHALDGTTYIARSGGQRKILTLAKRDGKPFIESSFELSGDGKVITESWVNPGSNGKGSVVYEKK